MSRFAVSRYSVWDWNSLETVKWLERQLRMVELGDWYRISFGQLQRLISSTVVNKNTLGKMLQEAYPDHPWDMEKLAVRTGAVRASQRSLLLVVQELFPTSGDPALVLLTESSGERELPARGAQEGKWEAHRAGHIPPRGIVGV